jgi:hypothetical protein
MEIVSEIPSWLHRYPPGYLRIVNQNIVKFSPWYLLDSKLASLRNEGLQTRYPNRHLFAFAARSDNDDIACWESGKPDRVIIVHDFASEGFANRREFASFWDWFRAAIEEMIAFEKDGESQES